MAGTRANATTPARTKLAAAGKNDETSRLKAGARPHQMFDRNVKNAGTEWYAALSAAYH